MPTATKRLPLVVAICDAAPGYEALFDGQGGQRFWRGHTAFGGIVFDHVREQRIAVIPARQACAIGGCSAPPEMRFAGTEEQVKSFNGWVAGHGGDGGQQRLHDRGNLPVPGLNGALVAYLDSADCWMHQGKNNPWHCLAGAINWNILTSLFTRKPSLLGLDGFDRTKATVLAVQGFDEFAQRQLVGWDDYAAAAAGFMADFHDDDHLLSKALKRGFSARVSLQGYIPVVVTNTAPSSSPVWGPVGSLPQVGAGTQVLAEYRAYRRANIANELGINPERPRKLPEDVLSLNDSIVIVRPAGDSTRKSVGLYSEDGFILVVRRFPHQTTPAAEQCGRCVLNIDEVAQSVADEFKSLVLFVYLSQAVSRTLQAYLFSSAKLIIGMHGGAWGQAVLMGPNQAAIEILPWPKASRQANAEHIVRLGGAKYAAVECSSCSQSKSRSGVVNGNDVRAIAAQLLTNEK